MVSLEEASERADQDSGDDDDVVWMKQNKKGRSRIYHDDPECTNLSSDSRVEFTRQQAQDRGYGPCKICTLGTADMSKTGSRPTDLIDIVRNKMDEK